MGYRFYYSWGDSTHNGNRRREYARSVHNELGVWIRVRAKQHPRSQGTTTKRRARPKWRTERGWKNYRKTQYRPTIQPTLLPHTTEEDAVEGSDAP